MAEKPETKASEENNIQDRQFSIQKIFTKDISFETPNTPQIFGEEWNAGVNMQIANEASAVSEDLPGLYEVVLRITVTVNLGDKTAYLVEVHQAGLFHIAGLPQEAIEHMLATMCPNILFPFAREVVSDIVTRGGFPQLLLSPVNFEALYAHEKQKAQQKQSDTTVDEDKTDVKH